jgi:hypothetical protein
MPTNVGIGYQMTFGIFNGVSYVPVAEVTMATPPQYSRDAIEATHMGSPNAFREYIPGLLDAGEATIEINYVPAAVDPILTAMRAGLGQFRITYPNGTTYTFSGIITAYTPETPMDGKLAATITIKVSSIPVLA